MAQRFGARCNREADEWGVWDAARGAWAPNLRPEGERVASALARFLSEAEAPRRRGRAHWFLPYRNLTWSASLGGRGPWRRVLDQFARPFRAPR